VLSIAGKPAKIFSSEGQKRSCLAALRLAEWERARELTTSPPILSIDDFGIHLDQKRYLLLQHQMKGLGQVFLTSPHPLGELLPADKFEILIKEGQLSSF
jgi:recombinational DNA repair ATPase RecF